MHVFFLIGEGVFQYNGHAMKSSFILALINSVLLWVQEPAQDAAPVIIGGEDGPTSIFLAKATPEQEVALTHIAVATKALQQLYATLLTLKEEADIKPALPAIEKAIDAYDESMAAIPDAWEPQADDLQEWRAAHRALRTLCTGEDFTQLVWHNDALKYYLLLKSAYLPCYLYAETAEYMMMASSMPGMEEDPAMAPHADKVRAEAAGRHAAFMQAHAAEYAGGNGKNTDSAIILLPLTALAEDAEPDDEVESQLISAYIHAVYPQFNSGYSFVRASPDGSLYVIMTHYPGVYEDAEGEPRLIFFNVYFCTKAPRKETQD